MLLGLILLLAPPVQAARRMQLCLNTTTNQMIVRNRCRVTEARVDLDNLTSWVTAAIPEVYYAYVDENGTAVVTSPALTVSSPGTGAWYVDIGRDAQGCVSVASPGTSSNFGVTDNMLVYSGVVPASDPVRPGQIYVTALQTGPGGPNANTAWNLIVTCP